MGADANWALAEAAFLKAIEIARNQSAHLFQLRAATGLARLWQTQDRRGTARELLTDIRVWFSDDVDSVDLRDANGVLAELS